MSYSGYPDPLVIYVRTNPGIGEFGSIQDAIDSITDNSTTKLYEVHVDPGIWAISSTIVMKPYVLLVGTTGLTVLFWAGAANINMITGCYNTAIWDMNIGSAVSGTGYAIYYDGTSTDPAHPAPATSSQAFSLSNVRFGAASNLGLVEGSTTNALLVMNNCSWGGTASIGTGFEIIGGTLARINARSCITVASTMTAPYPTFMFKVHGTNALLNLTDVSMETGGTSGIGIWVYDGGGVRCAGSLLSGFTTGVYSEFVGAAPLVYLPALTFFSNTIDIDIDHTGTVGNFTGVSDYTKVVSASNTFRWGYLDAADGYFEITNSLAVQFPFGTHTDIVPLLSHQGLGLISGGNITPAGGLDVAISDLTGYYINSVGEIALAELTAIPNETLPADSETYVFVDTNGALATSGAAPDPVTTLVLGRVVTLAASVLFVDSSHVPLTPSAQNYSSLLQTLFGALYVSGSVVTAGSTPLKLDVTGGVYYVGANRFEPVGGSDITLTTLYQDVVPGDWVATAGVTSVPTGFYDDGSGTLAAIPALSFVKHVLYCLRDGSDEYFLVYGQDLFASSPLAIAGNLPSPPSYFNHAVVPIASLVVESGAALIDTILSERSFPNTQSAATAPVSAHASLTGLTTGNAGHTQFLMLNGTTTMAANLNMGTFAITNVGLVDGVDVSAHEARHLPGGADPLATAAPLIAISALTANAVGTANSFARSDHQHSFDASTVVKQTITNGVTSTAPSEDAVYDALQLKQSKIAGVISVGTSGADYTTISAGLAAAAAGQTVLVHPGTYAETVDFTGAAAGVRVTGFPNAQNVRITGPDATSSRIILNKTGTLREVLVIGPSAGANPAIDASGLTPGNVGVLYAVVVQGAGGTGPLVKGAGTGVLACLSNIIHFGGATTGAFVEITGGEAILQGMFGASGSCSDFLKVSGGFVTVTNSFVVDTAGTLTYSCTDLIDISGGVLAVNGLSGPESDPPCVNGLHISGDGVNVDLISSMLHSTAFDILVDGGLTGVGTTIALNAEYRQEAVDLGDLAWVTNADWISISVDTGVSDDPGFKVVGEFTVGNPQQPSEAAFGTGDSTTLGMQVWVANNATAGATFTDKTAEAKSRLGSTFTYPTNPPPVNQCLYVGSEGGIPFVNLRMSQTVAALLGSGTVVLEVNDSAGAPNWVPLKYMVSEADTPYTRLAQNAFTVLQSQIRFGIEDANFAAWVPCDPSNGAIPAMATKYYWVRLRIATNTLTTGPTFQRLKTGFSRTELNRDGRRETVGYAEVRSSLASVSLGSSTEFTGSSAAGNSNISVSTNLSFGQLNNSLALSDGLGWSNVPLSGTVDTSRPLILKVYWNPAAASSGETLTLSGYLVGYTAGTLLNGGLTEQTVTDTQSSAGEDVVVVSTLTFDISALGENTVVALGFKRTAGTMGVVLRVLGVQATVVDWMG